MQKNKDTMQDTDYLIHVSEAMDFPIIVIEVELWS